MINQSMNLANLLRGGEFEMETMKDKEIRAKKDYEHYQEYLRDKNAKD